MKYVIIHGYGSNPETSTSVSVLKSIITAYDSDATILTPTYDVYDIQSAVKPIVDVVDEYTVVIGVSLGGFIARYVANVASAFKLILVNPSIHAYDYLKKYPELRDSVRDHFKSLYVDDDHPDLGILVLLAMDDDVIDPLPTYNLYRDRAMVIQSNGGHPMTTLHSLDHHIFKFLNTING